MSKIEINKEFKKYLDQLCENHIIKITKKNETENSVSFSFIIVIFIFMWYN